MRSLLGLLVFRKQVCTCHIGDTMRCSLPMVSIWTLNTNTTEIPAILQDNTSSKNTLAIASRITIWWHSRFGWWRSHSHCVRIGRCQKVEYAERQIRDPKWPEFKLWRLPESAIANGLQCLKAVVCTDKGLSDEYVEGDCHSILRNHFSRRGLDWHYFTTGSRCAIARVLGSAIMKVRN